MKLVIVESPAKAKTLEKYLGKDYTVKASVGHVRDLPKSNKQAIEVDKGFLPHYQVNPDKKKVIGELKRLAQKADQVILATDPDREGEAIAWHLAEVLKLKHPQRVAFPEITKETVQKAMQNPRAIDQDLRKAQEARRVLDRLVGYDLSGLIWKKVRYGLSAGRVQSPALRIIMEREREIRAFQPEKFWVLTAQTLTKNKELLTLECGKKIKKQAQAEKILQQGKAGEWQVRDVQETQVSKNPTPPFITSTLQQTASSRLHFSPSRSMMLAQRLYEAGLITYMRTDSTNLSQEAQNQIKKAVKQNFGSEYYSSRVFAKKSKNAQEAHEAIRPTDFSKKKAGLDTDQQKLYQLIWTRAVTSQMSAAKIARTKIIAGLTKDTKFPDFIAKGSRVIFDGFLKADPGSRQKDQEVPKVQAQEDLKLKQLDSQEKATTPPKRYSEAGLIKELEKRGIGRPSTYASIIKTIQDRQYVEKREGALCPTDTGDVVSSFLEDSFTRYISDDFTAQLEDKLDEMAAGERDYQETLEDFYQPFQKEITEKTKKVPKLTNLGEADPQFKCPVCQDPMVIKLGKGGKFLSCSKFPDCQGALTLEGQELATPQETGEKCPECEKPLIEKEGRFGKFVACSGYPKCRYIKKDAQQEAQNSTGVKCPQCQKGEMAEKRGRFGIFYACSAYPKCRYAIKSKPTGKICDYPRPDKDGQPCGQLMMEGTKTIPERCSDKACPNHNPHKLK